MTPTVTFTPQALEQLDKLERDIAVRGSPLVAARYVDAIVDYCENCESFRSEAPSATIFGRACVRLDIGDA